MYLFGECGGETEIVFRFNLLSVKRVFFCHYSYQFFTFQIIFLTILNLLLIFGKNEKIMFSIEYIEQISEIFIY